MNAPLWFSDLLLWSTQVAIIAFAAWLLARILRIEEPRALLIQWRTLILACLLLPLVEPWHRLTANLLIPAAALGPFPDSAAAPSSAPSQSALSIALLAQIIGIVILAGIALRLTIIALGLFKLRQLRRTSSPVPAQTEFPPILAQMAVETGARAEARISAKLHSPVTFGFGRPIILLPERFFHLDAPSQATILCHELLHVRRRDWAHHLAEETLRALLWFHPAIHWLVARVRLAREQLVDREVVRLTGARKTYLQALLEFTGTPSRTVAIPAPPFLAERQVVERVALMLKEVRMSRTRMIASLSAAACLLSACAVLAVSVFPLQAAPRPQNPSQAQTAAPASSPVVEANTIWTNKVKRGDMPIQVRGLAKALSANQVRVSLPEGMMRDVQVGQSVLVDTHHKMRRGHVSSVSMQVVAGVRTADVALDSPLPKGIDSSATPEATITIADLKDVVYVGRPAHTGENLYGATLPIFKVTEDGKDAERVTVQFGRASATTIQVLSGLEPGDTVILSDMAPYDKFSRVRIKR
jgi:beta-lactamase regulating signal transducer with metallopeptidase domain